MNVNVGVWGWLTKVAWLLFFVVLGITVYQWYVPLFEQNVRMRRKKLEIEAKITEEERSAARLRASTEAMNDPRTIERLAREKLGLARTNETIIHFEVPAVAGTLRP